MCISHSMPIAMSAPAKIAKINFSGYGIVICFYIPGCEIPYGLLLLYCAFGLVYGCGSSFCCCCGSIIVLRGPLPQRRYAALTMALASSVLVFSSSAITFSRLPCLYNCQANLRSSSVNIFGMEVVYKFQFCYSLLCLKP